MSPKMDVISGMKNRASSSMSLKTEGKLLGLKHIEIKSLENRKKRCRLVPPLGEG